MLVKRQQQLFVKLYAIELAIGHEGIDRPDHLEFLRSLGAAVAVDIATGVQVDLAPDADRVERHFDLMQPFGRATLTPKIIVGGMRSEERRVGKECRSRW